MTLIETAPGVVLGVTVTGPADGPLALLLHGFPDSPATWRHLVPVLEARGYRVAVPAMRGYLPSSHDPAGNYELAALAADCDALHHALGGDERAVLIGHDWGAAVAYVALAASPERWSKGVTISVPPLAVMAAAFFTYEQLQKSWYMFFFQNPLADFVVPTDNLSFIDRLWADWSPGYDATNDLSAVKQALATPEALGAALGYYRAMFTGNALSQANPLLAPYVAAGATNPTQPVLYLHGREDGCIGAAAVADTPAHLSAASSMTFIEGAGHFVQLEAPDVVSSLIVSWLTPIA